MCRGDIESSLLDLRAVNMTPIRVMSAAVLICFILGLLSPASSARKCVSSHLDFSLRTLYVINDTRTLISWFILCVRVSTQQVPSTAEPVVRHTTGSRYPSSASRATENKPPKKTAASRRSCKTLYLRNHQNSNSAGPRSHCDIWITVGARKTFTRGSRSDSINLINSKTQRALRYLVENMLLLLNFLP